MKQTLLALFCTFSSLVGLANIVVTPASHNHTEASTTLLFGTGSAKLSPTLSANIQMELPSSLRQQGDSLVLVVNRYSFPLNLNEPFFVSLKQKGDYEMKALLWKDGDILEQAEFAVHVLPQEPLITNDAIVFGILMLLLGMIFHTSHKDHAGWKRFYTFVPALLLCYLLPSLLNTFGVINSEYSGLYGMAKKYLLPASLLLLTLSVDLKGIVGLGSKALIMFFTATVGIILGGPFAILVVGAISPETVGGTGENEVWRGLATLAGSWIGGGANQAAMLEVYKFSKDGFGAMVAVDIIVANIWMATLLYGAGRKAAIDRWLRADSSAIDDLTTRIENYRASILRIPKTADIMKIAGVAFACVSLATWMSDEFTKWFVETYPEEKNSTLASSFFWVVVLTTTFGLILSGTRARKLEGVGASTVGSVFIYILVATIGMHMDISMMLDNPGLFAVGLLWMAFHVALLLLVARLIKAPFFFVAVGSKANVGGAASAPVVASAFNPSLASVGVLLAVLGYALGTYGAALCAELMRMVSP